MFDSVRANLVAELDGIRDAGLEKQERVIDSPQGSSLVVEGALRGCRQRLESRGHGLIHRAEPWLTARLETLPQCIGLV